MLSVAHNLSFHELFRGIPLNPMNEYVSWHGIPRKNYCISVEFYERKFMESHGTFNETPWNFMKYSMGFHGKDK